jgi:hypothetical protein
MTEKPKVLIDEDELTQEELEEEEENESVNEQFAKTINQKKAKMFKPLKEST